MTITDKPLWTAMARRATILKVDFGSRGYGLDLRSSDHDHKAIVVEDFSANLRLADAFETLVEKYDVDIDPDYPQGLDIQFISLSKFIHMVLGCNPTMLGVLWGQPLFADERGTALQALRSKIVSKKAGAAFLGFMRKEIGRSNLDAFTPKNAYLILRLGYSGIELLQTGTMTIPFEGDRRNHLMKVRSGNVPAVECLQEASYLEATLDSLRSTTDLPDEPDTSYVDIWMRSVYWDSWQRSVGSELLLNRAELGTEIATVH